MYKYQVGPQRKMHWFCNRQSSWKRSSTLAVEELLQQRVSATIGRQHHPTIHKTLTIATRIAPYWLLILVLAAVHSKNKRKQSFSILKWFKKSQKRIHPRNPVAATKRLSLTRSAKTRCQPGTWLKRVTTQWFKTKVNNLRNNLHESRPSHSGYSLLWSL